MKKSIIGIKLELVDNDGECSEYKLKNANGEVITRYSVEWNKTNALISYETCEKYRNQGYASLGLNMLRKELFTNNRALTLELINLSGDYSRKVAENAGFFSPHNSIDYYVTINPFAEEVLESKLQQCQSDSKLYTQLQRLLQRIKALKKAQRTSRIKMQEKLDELKKTLEVADDEGYKEELMAEVTHLEGIINQVERENEHTGR